MSAAYVALAASLAGGAAPAMGAGWQLATADTTMALEAGQAPPASPGGPSPGECPVITVLRHPAEQHNWAGSPLPLPLMARVESGGHPMALAWRFREATTDPAAGRLTLTFASRHPRLVLRSIWRARPGHGPVEHWVEMDNLTAQPVTVTHQGSLTLERLACGGSARVYWVRRGGGNAGTQGGTFAEPVSEGLDLALDSNCEDGASPVPWAAVQVGEQRGLYVGWEFSGLGRVHVRGLGPRTVAVDLGLHSDFRTDIGPGETFVVPTGFVGCYVGDVDEGSYCLHRFVLEKLRATVPQGCPDPVLAYNLYLDAGGNNAREADVLRSARLCADLGFEAFMPDAMWFPATGDWRWDPARFPNGVAPVERFVHDQGMRLALWCAWTNGGVSADPEALSVRGPVGHPDWFNGAYEPEWQPGPFYGAQLCLACPEAREWALRKTEWLVRHHQLDYLKHDCGPITNQCDKTTHRHRYGVDTSYWATRGYYEVMDNLRRAFPSLLLEDCSGGGHIKDFGVIQRTHYTVTTDTLSNLPDRQSIYDSTFALPPLLLQAYTYNNVYPVEGDDPGPFLWRSAMMSAWQIDPTNTAAWTEEQQASAQRAAAIYKEWVRPLLQDVKVHHILPRPDGRQWDGLFYWSPPLRRGMLYVFRPAAPESRRVVPLKGLDAGHAYWVWSEDGSVRPQRRTGAELMTGGLAIRLRQRYTCDLVYFQDGVLGPPPGLSRPGPFGLQGAEASSDAFGAAAELSWEPSAGARGYRVAVLRGPGTGEPGRSPKARVVLDCTVVRPSVSLPGLPPGEELSWRVEAVSWGGRRWNTGGPGVLTTPPLRELTGVTFASDLPWVSATAGADNPVRRDRNYYGRPIAIAGRSYPKGLWTHAFEDRTPADVVFDIAGRGFGAFAADVGLDDASGAGSVQFQVLVDGRLAAESPVMRPQTVHALRVEVTGAAEVTLRVLNGGDGYTCDHAAWGLARLIAEGRGDPLPPGR